MPIDFTIDYAAALLFIGTVFTFLSTPGPVTLLVINNATKGLKAGFFTILGTNIASLILIFISYLIVLGVVSLDEGYLTWMRLFGALYLVWFAYGIIKESYAPIEEHHSAPPKPSKHFFRQGFLIGISNPKDIVFFSSFFTGFISITPHLNTSYILLTILWIILDYAILFSYCLFIQRSFMEKHLKMVIRLSGAFLMLAALYVFYLSISTLFF